MPRQEAGADTIRVPSETQVEAGGLDLVNQNIGDSSDTARSDHRGNTLVWQDTRSWVGDLVALSRQPREQSWLLFSHDTSTSPDRHDRTMRSVLDTTQALMC
jgi:hypothetical protein